jgi:hypothetical protein
MTIYPAIVFVVSTLFAFAVFRQYQDRHRPYQLVWTISLAMAAIGSLAYIIFLDGGKSAWAFRIYYIGGALLTAPLLGLGSLLLSARTEAARARMRIVTIIVAVVCVLGAMLLLTAQIDQHALSAVNGGPGQNVFKQGPWLPVLILSNIFGAVAVVAVALYSGWQLYKRQTPRQMVAANVLIAVGVYVISQAGGQARTGLGAGAFWLVMTVGWIVLFGGFLLTYRVQHTTRTPATARGAVAGTQA